MRIPKELIKHLDMNNVVPFIGAGYSYMFGYPTWDELLSNIIDKLKLDINKEDIKGRNALHTAEALFQIFKRQNQQIVMDDLQEEHFKDVELNAVTQDYLTELTRKKVELKFNELVCKCLERKERGTTHEEYNDLKLINKFEFKDIVTTNYDQILEQEVLDNPTIMYPKIGRQINKVDETNNKTLYKIHGDMADPLSIVLTNSQYYTFMHNEGYYKSKLYTFFASSVIIMLGYGFSDINIQDIYFQFRRDYFEILNKTEGNNSKVYLIIRKEEAEEQNSYYQLYKEYLNSNGIEVIDNFSSISSFLKELYLDLENYKKNKLTT